MKQLNKTLVYTLVAILLGTVTMVAPLALLGPELDPGKDLLTVTPSNEPGSQALEGTRENDSYNSLDVNLSETDSPYGIFYVSPGGSSLNLLPIGLLLIPSFLIALGVFVYFKKRSF